MRITAAASLLGAFTALASVQACSSDNTPSNTSTPDGGAVHTSPTDGGDATNTTTDGGGGIGGTGVLWFVSTDVKKIGSSDLAGNELWSEHIDDKPQDVVIGGGAAWVLTNAGNVLRYDLTSHAKTPIAVAKKPSHILFAAGAVWVTDDDDGSACVSVDEGPVKLLRIDPATNTVTQHIAISATTTFACNNRIDGLASDGTSIFVLVDNAFGLARVDPSTNKVANRIALGTGAGYGNGFVTVGGTNLWVHNTDAKTLIKVDPTTLVAGTPTPITADYLGEHWVASADALYLDKPDESILRIDAQNPATQTPYPIVGSPDHIQLHEGTLWISYTESLDTQFALYDTTTLAVKSKINSLVYADAFAFVP